ncbi:MAG: hypothetical protein IJC49_07510 [Clostridia bacterium]|nr:hypothetical protein [Clostridia bacterium]
MDYEGNYFPDEEEKELPRSKKIRKRIIRYILYGLVLFVYLVAFWVIFTNCEPSTYEEYVFSPEAREIYEKNPEEFMVYEIFPPVFMNFDGSVQLSGVAYAENAKELEIGIKYNKNLITNENGDKPLFSLVDTDGNVYEVCNTVEDDKGRYHYYRLSFKGANLDLDGNVYINSEASTAAEGEGEMFETFSYKLVITYPEGSDIKLDEEDEDKHKDEIVIFNSATPIQLTKYK